MSDCNSPMVCETEVGFIYNCSILFSSTLFNFRIVALVHFLQTTSSEGVQHHLKICMLWLLQVPVVTKKNVAFTYTVKLRTLTCLVYNHTMAFTDCQRREIGHLCTGTFWAKLRYRFTSFLELEVNLLLTSSK